MALFSLLITILLAQPFGIGSQPVVSTHRFETVSADTVRLVFDLKISDGWHVYSTSLPKGGPTSASLDFDTIYGAEPASELLFSGNEIENIDPFFDIKVRYFEKKVSFHQDFRITADEWRLEGAFSFGACNDESCLPPQHVEFSHSSTPANTSQSPTAGTDLSNLKDFDQATWSPAQIDAQTTPKTGSGLWGLFLTSFLGGLIALFTPCVWPVIPMTVSFFLKRSSTRSKAVRDAILYGFSIIAVYVALGLAITLIFGANALNALATNAVVNILFFLILVAFALSFFGLFEITLPSGWSTGTDRKSTAAGLGGIFFMALTLTIVSFSCTGPIIGFLLVDAASTGSILAPTIGMLGFSVAMAIPFTLFAMFPGWLQSMPKSGGWMDKVKVTLGVIELAFSLKFLSVADMAYGWGILPRDLFILLWILMALFLGLYLLGLFGRRKNGKKQKPGPIGITVGILSLAFAIWLVPGLWGAPLKAISAFTPPMSTQILGHNDHAVEPQFTDYNDALKASGASGKPVLIDFTGYGCVNCRKMEAAVWTDPRVSGIIKERYILTSLFVDDKTTLEETVSVVENGTKVKIRTVGDKWSLLQRYKFGANAQPFYVIVDSKGNLIKGPYTFDPNPEDFLKFLK
ncbi:MAG: thioredoxin family protein [Bacteroidaceae bacterium]|nr:thioredoxin family protein [Bacteroidaceae bacterium]